MPLALQTTSKTQYKPTTKEHSMKDTDLDSMMELTDSIIDNLPDMDITHLEHLMILDAVISAITN